MRFDHPYRPVLLSIVFLFAAWGFAPAPASAQPGGAGLRAGVSGGPDQFYFGGHVDTGRIAGDLSFRPNVEVGIGNDETTVAGNFEFVYWFPIRHHAVDIYAGGGPAINFYRWGGNGDSHTETDPGFNLLVGVSHHRGLFGELKIGLLDSPEVKFGVGYTWR